MLERRHTDRLAAAATSWSDANAVYLFNPIAAAAVRNSLTSPGAIPVDPIYGDVPVTPLSVFLQTEWRSIAERRATAIVLAISLYRVDHQQHWPASLAELVPTYLPAVPDDPFQKDGTPIGYIIRKNALPDGSDRPLLYFDLNEKPETAKLPATPTFGWNGAGPQWRDLSRWYMPGTQNSPQQTPNR